MKKKISCILLFLFASISGVIADNDLTGDVSSDSFDNEYLLLEEDATPLVIYGVLQSGQDTQVMGRSEIDALNPGSVSDILTRGFNLSVNSNGATGNQSSVNIRGLSGARVLILVDGVPVNSPQSGDFDISTLDVNSIEKIEVVKGGSDTKYAYSGAMGGLINIVTRSGRTKGFTFYGSSSNSFYYPDFYYPGRATVVGEKSFSKWFDFFDTQRLNTGFSLSSGSVSYDASFSLNRAGNHFIYRDDYTIKRRLVNNEILDFNVSNGFVFNLPHYIIASLSGSYYYADRNISGAVNSDNPGKQFDYKGHGQFSLKADFVGTDNIFTEFITNYNHSTMEWTDSFGYSKHQIDSVFAVNRWGFIITDWVTLNTGSDIAVDCINSNMVGTLYVINGGSSISADFNINKKVLITPFLKLIYNPKYPVPIPKISSVFIINDFVRLKANFFRVFRVPSINDLYWPSSNYAKGNPLLDFEDGFGGDFIVEYVNNRLFSAESSIYSNYIQNVIQWQNNNGQWIPNNTGAALFIGSGHTLKTLFSRYFYCTAQYEFLLSFLVSDGLTILSDKRMPYKPVHTFGFSITGDWQSGHVTLSGNYQSERFTNSTNAGFLNPFFILDVDINQTFHDFTFFLSFKNMLNLYYFLIEDYPMPNGSVTLGISYRFSKSEVKSK